MPVDTVLMQRTTRRCQNGEQLIDYRGRAIGIGQKKGPRWFRAAQV